MFVASRCSRNLNTLIVADSWGVWELAVECQEVQLLTFRSHGILSRSHARLGEARDRRGQMAKLKQMPLPASAVGDREVRVAAD